MVDIHTHILPFVDDGSPSVEVSLKMLENQCENGVSAVVLTPHYSVERGYLCRGETLKKAFFEFKNQVEKANIDIKLYLGQEIYWSDGGNIVDLLRSGELLTINGSKYVLLEFSSANRPESVSDVLYTLGIYGYKAIIAHVERYRWITQKLIDSMRAKGALIQINADSLLGKGGLRLKLFCKKIIKRGLVDFVASDEHSFRPSNLKKAREILKNDKYFALPQDVF